MHRYSNVGLAALILGACALGPPAHAVSPRQQIQHLLRRFAFSAPPETVTSVLSEGVPAWLAAQDDWQAIGDSNSELETIPTQLNAQGGYVDYNVFERIVMQHMVLTQRQLQAKLELHWLDHFAVGLEKVGDPAIQYHYDQIVRANALGNFTTLVTAVAQEAAMLVWLDNNWNVGPVANENWGRECMQLYTMGLDQLNMDGSAKTGPKWPATAELQPGRCAGDRQVDDRLWRRRRLQQQRSRDALLGAVFQRQPL